MKTRIIIWSLVAISIIAVILIMWKSNQNEQQENKTVQMKVPLNLKVTESDGAVTAQLFSEDSEDVDYYLGYVNDTVFYARKENSEDSRNVESFLLQTEGEKPQLMERRAGYLLSRGYAFWRNSSIVFSFLAESDNPEWGYGENVFLQYDVEKKEGKEVKGRFPTEINACYPWMENKLLYSVEDCSDINTTYLGVFDLNSEEEERYCEYNFPTEHKEWLAACTDGNEVKGLYSDFSDRSGLNMDYSVYLSVFDQNFREKYTCQLDDDLKNYVLEYGFVTYMVSYDEYVYINNNYNQNCLIRLEDGKAVELFRGNDFRIGKTMDGSAPLFFYEGTNRVFRINEENDLEEIDLCIPNDGSLKDMLADRDSCFVKCICGNKEYAYTFSRESLTGIKLPCE